MKKRPRPFYRKARGLWYIQIGSKQFKDLSGGGVTSRTFMEEWSRPLVCFEQQRDTLATAAASESSPARLVRASSRSPLMPSDPAPFQRRLTVASDEFIRGIVPQPMRFSINAS